MWAVIYDGTFEGWLTAEFELYEHGFTDVTIYTEKNYQNHLFGNELPVVSNEHKAGRVWKGLSKKVSANALHQLYQTWLSEIPGIDNTMLRYVQYAFQSASSIETDHSHEAVNTVVQTAKKVHREKHRMEAFVRFQLTKDLLFYAIVEPDFNVLPLISRHFKSRYADQRWMIYDGRRQFGIYYDLDKVDTVQIKFEEGTNNGKDITSQYNDNELMYQQLWKRYFGSVNIASRKNTRLHIQHMPVRYWKYLPEKR